MIRKICRECGSVTIRTINPEGEEKRFCEKCDAFVSIEEAEMDPFCPDCRGEITIHATC